MKTEVLKSFSSFGCDCQLVRVSFEHSRQMVYQVSVRYLVTPKDWNFNYQVLTFDENESAAKQFFTKCVREFI